ncbi:MAG: HD family hydrolase [Desulfurococcales archaeon]|nr:HD family hydrolase [Desulfurococcales archaeon]
MGGDADIVRVLESLSALARTGWMLRGVPHQCAESVAEHSFWSAVLAFEIAVRARSVGVDVDPYGAAAIALFHDVGEAVIGDIAKVSGISEEEKVAAEERAVRSMGLSGEAKGLVGRFNRGEDVEARIAKLAEVLATLLKALSYERRGFDVSDIRDNMLRRVRELAGELGVLEVVREVSGIPDL